MKRIIIITAVIYLTAVGLLFSMAPDALSMVILGVMTLLLAFGFLAGIMPAALYAGGFNRCRKSIEESTNVQTTETWLAVFKVENIFGQKELDSVFRDYKNTVEQERLNDEPLSDIVDFINEDYLSLHTWRGVVLQIPGTLTGLGILGTFIGLIMGIGSVGFSTVEAAIDSISSLLAGIEMAFFTSIAGVILSIIFNIFYHFVWNIMLREYGLFVDAYHKIVIPSSEDQLKKKMDEDMKVVLSRLDRLPAKPGFSLAHTGGSAYSSDSGEQGLMEQVFWGLQNREFTFYLQPAIELGTKKPVRAEALVRWNHRDLGVLHPSVFLPALERNGFITKIDTYIWEAVCNTISEWLHTGLHPVPIAVNLSQTDILAMDTVSFFEEMVEKYNIPPRMIELEIAQNAYTENPVITSETAAALRRHGFKVILDDFDGDYISVNMFKGLEADETKLDLRYIKSNEYGAIEEIFEQANKLGIAMSAEEIDNAEQITYLTRANCSVGQGNYFYRPMSIDEFQNTMVNA